MLPNPFAMQGADALRPNGISEIGMAPSLNARQMNPVNMNTEMMGITEIGMENQGFGNHHNPFRKSVPNLQQPGMGPGMVMGGGAPTSPWSPSMENQLMGHVPAGLERFGSPYRSMRSSQESFMSPSARAP